MGRYIQTKNSRRALVLLLFVLALVVRGVRAWQLPVVMPDAIRYIQQAQLMAVSPLRAVREEVYHPLFSLAILSVHHLLAIFYGGGVGGDRMSWIWAAQAIGILCGALMSVLIYALARRLGAPFWSALAGAVVWIIGRRTSAYGADGMSDTLALCLFTGSMLAAIGAMGFRRRGPTRLRTITAKQLAGFALAGILAGFAYLTRPEGLAAPLIVTITLLLTWAGSLVKAGYHARARKTQSRRFKIFPQSRLSGRAVSAGLACMLLAAAIPAIPYVAMIGKLTNKKHLFSGMSMATAIPRPVNAVAATGILPELPLSPLLIFSPGFASAPVVAVMTTLKVDKNPVQWVWEEVCKTFGYASMVVLLFPIFWHWRFWGRPRLRLLVCVWAAVWYVVMFWLLLSSKYLNGRHTLPLEVLGFALLGVALPLWARPIRAWMTMWEKRPPVAIRWPAWARWAGWPGVFAAGVFVFIAMVDVAQLPDPPWEEGIPVAQAVAWVREHVGEDVMVCDKQQLVGYYAQRPFTRWYGAPDDPRMDEVHNIKVARAAQSGKDALIVIGRLFEQGKGVDLHMGTYRAIAVFGAASVPPGERADIYVLYAQPGEKVLKDEKVPDLIEAVPASR